MTPLRKILEELEARARLGEDKEADYFSVNIAHQQILALIPKKRSHMDECDYDAYSCTCGAEEYNQAIDKIEQSMTGEK